MFNSNNVGYSNIAEMLLHKKKIRSNERIILHSLQFNLKSAILNYICITSP
jgi:hypothetical protein